MEAKSIRDARIAVIDDEAANVELVVRILELDGYTNVSGYTDPLEFLDTCRFLPPDLMLMDLRMPEINGFQVLERLKQTVADFDYRPVMVITSDDDRETKQKALSSGARDFLSKPVSPVEVRLRVGNLLHTRFLQLELQRHAERLEDRVKARTAQLEEARIEILERLALAAEYRDDATGEHTRRVGRESAALANALGLSLDEVEDIRRNAPYVARKRAVGERIETDSSSQTRPDARRIDLVDRCADIDRLRIEEVDRSSENEREPEVL